MGRKKRTLRVAREETEQVPRLRSPHLIRKDMPS